MFHLNIFSETTSVCQFVMCLLVAEKRMKRLYQDPLCFDSYSLPNIIFLYTHPPNNTWTFKPNFKMGRGKILRHFIEENIGMYG